jgi:hypothetical protein
MPQLGRRLAYGARDCRRDGSRRFRLRRLLLEQPQRPRRGRVAGVGGHTERDAESLFAEVLRAVRQILPEVLAGRRIPVRLGKVLVEPVDDLETQTGSVGGSTVRDVDPAWMSRRAAGAGDPPPPGVRWRRPPGDRVNR